jgi:hypothetical protein
MCAALNALRLQDVPGAALRKQGDLDAVLREQAAI